LSEVFTQLIYLGRTKKESRKLMAIVIFALAACRGAAAQAPKKPLEVQVTLSEFKFESSLTTFSKGVPYHFVVTNQGSVPYEFMILPPMAPGAMSMGEMHKMAVGLIDEDDLPPGTTQTLDITFTESAPEGKLEFACHLPGHYEAGMHLPIVVK
jgi:uncharacterized cupredoxin-like copper-binding protein